MGKPVSRGREVARLQGCTAAVLLVGGELMIECIVDLLDVLFAQAQGPR